MSIAEFRFVGIPCQLYHLAIFLQSFVLRETNAVKPLLPIFLFELKAVSTYLLYRASTKTPV